MKITKLFFVSFILGAKLFAQNSSDSLYINNVHAGFHASGDLFYNDSTGTSVFSFNNHHIDAAANLWIGGYDMNNQLHIAAQTYRQTGDDFWSGPLDTTTIVCDSASNLDYNKVWKVSCSEINDYFNFLNNGPAPGYSIPNDFVTWPGNGNAALGQTHYIAPFFDADADGYYNYASGDYPDVRGHQSLFYVYNDHLANAAHTETGGMPMGLEIRTMPYAFQIGWSNAVSNSIFIHYQIINRGTLDYDSTIIALWSDIDLGSQQNTHTGSDSLLNCYYIHDSAYAVGITFLNHPMAGAISYNNDFSVTGNPANAQEYYQYMNQHWKNNAPLTYGSNGYGGPTSTTWMYSGEPATGNGWNEPYSISDDKVLGAGQPFTLYPGMVISFDVAFVFAKDTSAPYACVPALKQSIQEVRNFYLNENQFCTPGLTGTLETINEKAAVSASPNPVSSQLIIHTSSTQFQSYSILDLTGKLLQSGKTSGNETIINVEQLPAGMYFLQVGNEKEIQALKIIKAE